MHLQNWKIYLCRKGIRYINSFRCWIGLIVRVYRELRDRLSNRTFGAPFMEVIGRGRRVEKMRTEAARRGVLGNSWKVATTKLYHVRFFSFRSWLHLIRALPFCASPSCITNFWTCSGIDTPKFFSINSFNRTVQTRFCSILFAYATELEDDIKDVYLNEQLATINNMYQNIRKCICMQIVTYVYLLLSMEVRFA